MPPRERRRKQVHVDPTQPTSVKLPRQRKEDNLLVSYGWHSMEFAVDRQRHLSTAGISNKKLAINQIVSNDFVAFQQRVDLADVGFPPAQ